MQNYWLNLENMTDIKHALQYAIHVLTSSSPSPRIDAEALLSHTLNVSRAYLYTYPERPLTNQEAAHYETLIKQRLDGHPVAYLTGSREFWSLPFHITQEVLIPRSDTELLVEMTLNQLASMTSATVLDLGTGSGAIAIALASEQPNWHIFAIDTSPSAVKLAQTNATHFNLSNVTTLQSDWFSAIPDRLFDAIVSNPPYLAVDDPHLKQGDLRFEPENALVSGPEGLNDLTIIIQESYAHLTPGGILLIEHGFEQGLAVTQLLHHHGYEQIQCWQDVQGHDRVSGGRRKND